MKNGADEHLVRRELPVIAPALLILGNQHFGDVLCSAHIAATARNNEKRVVRERIWVSRLVPKDVAELPPPPGRCIEVFTFRISDDHAMSPTKQRRHDQTDAFS